MKGVYVHEFGNTQNYSSRPARRRVFKGETLRLSSDQYTRRPPR
jgi:hypothetical protein